MKYFSYLIGIVFISVLLVLSAVSRAAETAPLADHVPADALVYMGWAGTNHLQNQYQKSNLKTIVDSSQIESLFKNLLPELVAAMGKKNNHNKAVVQALKPLLDSLIENPTAVYLTAGKNASGMPGLAVLTQAGNSAEKLKTKWKNLLKATGRMPFPVYLNTRDNNTVVFAAGIITPAQKKTLGIQSASKVAAAKPVSQDKLFLEDIKQTVSHPALLIHIDMNRMFALIEKWHHKIHHIPMGAVHKPGMPPDPKVVVRDLGLDGLNSFTFGAGFGEGGWDTALFVNAPAPRRGLLAAVGALGGQTLDHVPASAQYVQSFYFNLAQMLATIDKTVKDTNPQEYPSFARVIHEIDKALGASLIHQILPVFGNRWTLYLDKATGGTRLPGIIIIAHPKNLAKANKTLTDLSASVIRTIKKYGPKKIDLHPRTLHLKGQRVHVVPAPGISPSWVVANGVIYMGMYPQTALSAALYSGKTIAENHSFNRLRKKLAGDQSVVALKYYDLPNLLGQSYSSMLMMQGDVNFLRFFNIDVPVMIVPPLGDIASVLAPAVSIVTVDDKGLSFKIHEPFAGSLLIGLAGNYSAQQMMATLAVLLSSSGIPRL